MALIPKPLQQLVVIGLLGGFVMLLIRQMTVLGLVGGKAQPPPQAMTPVGPYHATVPQIVKNVEEHEEAVAARINTASQPAAQVVKYTAESLRDPFVNLLPGPVPPPSHSAGSAGSRASAVPPAPDLVVQGVIWGGMRPQALVNDGVYDLGDTIKEATIVDIRRDGITVSTNGHTYELGVSSGKKAPGQLGYRPPIRPPQPHTIAR
ncbi:MAG: hypothetical protein HYZ92_02960 [Candidatus Omnitrophica bacterium]|nr:hypothetical protein [Candidatus Omnitrophota bacterium]